MKNTLKSLFLVLGVCLSVNCLTAQAYSNHINPVELSKMKKTHPRVLVNDFEVIKQNIKSSVVMQGWLRELNKETTLDALALSYALTGDKEKLEKAVTTTFDMDWDKAQRLICQFILKILKKHFL